METMLRIAEIINEKEMTNVELAKKLDVSPQYVSEVINDHRNITIETAQRFAKALNVPIAALFDGYKPQGRTNVFSCPHCGKTIKVQKG